MIKSVVYSIPNPQEAETVHTHLVNHRFGVVRFFNLSPNSAVGISDINLPDSTSVGTAHATEQGYEIRVDHQYSRSRRLVEVLDQLVERK